MIDDLISMVRASAWQSIIDAISPIQYYDRESFLDKLRDKHGVNSDTRQIARIVFDAPIPPKEQWDRSGLVNAFKKFL